MTIKKLKEHVTLLNQQFQQLIDKVDEVDQKNNYVKIKELITAQEQELFETNKYIKQTIKNI